MPTPNQYRGYKYVRGPGRDEPNYIVQGPRGRDDIRVVDPRVFKRGQDIQYTSPDPPDVGAIRAVEQATGLTARPGVIPEPQRKPRSRQAAPKAKPYSLLPGYETARVRRMTLLRGNG